MRRLPFIAAAFGVFGVGLTGGWIAGDSRRPAPARETAKKGAPDGVAVAAPGVGAAPNTVAAQPKDFQTRFENLLNTGNQFERTRALMAIGDGLTLAEVRIALARAERYHGADRRELLARLASRWAELDPRAAFEWTQTFKADGCYQALDAAVETWARNDAKAAAERIAQMPEGFRTDRAVEDLVKGIAERDPKAAFVIFQSNVDRFGEYFARDFFEQWADTNPRSAAEAVVTLPAGSQRVRALRAVAERWGQSDRASALDWAESAQTTKAASGPGGRVDPEVTGQILQSWLSENPDAARRWIQELPSGEKKFQLLQVVCKSVGEEDPQLAAEFVSLLPTGSGKNKAARELMQHWAESDFSGALAWAQQADDDIRKNALPQLAARMAWTDPAGAMSLALSFGGGKAQERAATTVLFQWSAKDPAAAADWAATQPKNTIYWMWIARHWAEKDSAAASQWTATLPGGPEKDNALANGAEVLSKDEPQNAVQWIAQISDEKKRNAAYESLAKKWLDSAPAAARAWIEDAPLSPESKAKLLNTATP